MSHVTDILLCTAIGDGSKADDEHPNTDRLTSWLVKRYGPINVFKKLDHFAGGGKAMQCDVFGVAVNYCDIEELVHQFKAVPWNSPECAQLMVKDEHWDRFVVHNASGVG